jgi:membrane protease YdiL (CAAX protease family)
MNLLIKSYQHLLKPIRIGFLLVQLFVLSFAVFVINASLVSKLKDVSLLLHAVGVGILLALFFIIIRRYEQYLLFPKNGFSIDQRKSKQLLKGLLLALLFSFFAMCSVYLITASYTIGFQEFVVDKTLVSLFLSLVVAAFFEELIFRHFF